MFRKVVLGSALVGLLVFAAASTAEAQCYGGGYGGGYYGGGRAYPVHRSVYYYGGPSYYRGYSRHHYRGHPGYYHHGYYGGRSGVAFSIGF